MKIHRIVVIISSAIAIGLTSVACSSTNDHSTMQERSIPSDASFNPTDVGFAQGMIPHHAQAIEMADMALAMSTDPQVLDLARQIKAAQSPEVESMTGWLTGWGKPVPMTDSMAGHDMTGMDSMMMDGMMSQQDMDRLAAATGTEFDRLWLELMIQHHEGAVSMARAQVADGKDAAVIALAEAIITGQQAEITTMEELLVGLSA